VDAGVRRRADGPPFGAEAKGKTIAPIAPKPGDLRTVERIAGWVSVQSRQISAARAHDRPKYGQPGP